METTNQETPVYMSQAKYLVELELSDDFKKADQLIKHHGKVLESLKRSLKKANKTRVSFKRDGKKCTVLFNLRRQKRIDSSLMTMEEQNKFSSDSEVWIKNIIFDEMDVKEEDECIYL